MRSNNYYYEFKELLDMLAFDIVLDKIDVSAQYYNTFNQNIFNITKVEHSIDIDWHIRMQYYDLLNCEIKDINYYNIIPGDIVIHLLNIRSNFTIIATLSQLTQYYTVYGKGT